MWAWLSLLLALCLLHGGGAESEGGGPSCQPPPPWKASRLDGLRQKLESQGLRNVVYMVINHQGEQAQRLHPLLAQKLSQNIALYKQEEQQADVWQTLGGEKDDFFIYNRCGRLTHHISLPYSIIGQGHVETAIKETYCKRLCGDCIHESSEDPEECRERADAQPDADGPPAVDGATGHEDHGHHHHHGHHHGHGHGHHGGHGHEHGQHHANHHGGGHDHGQSPSEQGIRPLEQDGQVIQTPQHLDFSHTQLVVDMPQRPQEAQGAPVMQRP